MHRKTQFAVALALFHPGDTLMAAAAIYLGPKYQEGFVLGRQGKIPPVGSADPIGKLAAVLLFLGRNGGRIPIFLIGVREVGW